MMTVGVSVYIKCTRMEGSDGHLGLSVMLLEVYDRKQFGVQIQNYIFTVKLQFENQRTWLRTVCDDDVVLSRR